MSDLTRQSFSIERSLLKKLEGLRGAHSYKNRSEFLRDMIREQLVASEWKKNQEALGTITLIYNHESRELSKKLIHIQHHHHECQVLAATHVHLDHDLCAEMIMVRGYAGEIQKLCDLLRQQKGVFHAALSMGSIGKNLK
jgi:CopG family nickel-responsive transcriptional regulator